MKKNYTLRASLTLFIAMAMRLSAQLSGFVTIDSSQPTGGTIYQSFSALVSTLNAVGVSGPLIVNVTAGSGPYNEQVNFLQAPGISATNTITINGNGCTISYNGTVAATAWTILYTGADYMTVNNLNVVGTGTAQALTCHLWNGANNNTFNNCTFSSSTSGTGTNLVPFSVSGTSVSGTSTGLSGNNNTVNSCTMTGGYYNTVFTGSTSPLGNNNQVINSVLRDFYFYGLYFYYNQNPVARGNIIERPNRTTISTGYGIYVTTGCIGSLVERNHVRRLADGSPGSTSALYAIYVSADGTLVNPNIFRNNLVSDLRSSGTQAGIYFTGPAFAYAYHNTIVLSDPTSTAGTTYGIYCTGPNDKVRNNVASITRAGTGTKYCVYLSTAATNLDCNFNVLHINSPAGSNNVGYLGTAYATLSTWQTDNNYDLGSTEADPVFANPVTMNYVPTSTLVNNLCAPVGVTNDFNLSGRSLVFPDPGAFEIFNLPCNSAPGPNSFTTPSISLCPGTTQTFSLTSTNTYTNSGYSLQWFEATQSNLGPYTAAAGGTLNSFITAPINMTTYYVAVITCTNGNASYTTNPGMVQVALTTTNSVPYYESFESLTLNDLPNCSWSGTSMGNAMNTYTSVNTSYRVPRTGTNYAAFSNSPSGTNYFYSNGIWMNSGVTYSAALWFIHEVANVNNWTDLSIMVGNAQTAGAMTQVATTNGTLTPNLYTLLSNTFTIPLSGYYYVGVRGTSGGGIAPYLTWDDLSVTIPCNLNGPPMQVSASSNTICSNQSSNLMAIGANTYSWSTGQTSSAIVVTPTTTSSYTVTGFNTLSGCPKSLVQTIVVKTAPSVAAFANDPVSCAGNPVNVSAQGAAIYNWSSGTSGQTAIVTPTTTTTYSVIGTNSINCSSMATVEVVVNPLPIVLATASSTLFCNGQSITFNGSGAVSYQWLTGSNIILLGSPVNSNPMASGTYTLIGTNSDGCQGLASISFGVEECTSLNELSGGNSLVNVYPNPTNGLFTVSFPASYETSIRVYDVNGRIVVSETIMDGKTTINLNEFSNGVYYLKARSQNFVETVKIVKQ